MRKVAVASCRKWLWMYVRSTPRYTAAPAARALTVMAKKPGQTERGLDTDEQNKGTSA